MWSLPLSIYLESKAIDLKEYSIIAGKYCWVIQVDFLVSVPFFSYNEALPIYLRLIMKYVCIGVGVGMYCIYVCIYMSVRLFK